jgi:hypothetical protein
MEIDWDATRAVLRSEMPERDAAGDDAARRALELLLGEQTLRQSVDYYAELRPARELVRSVLWVLRPWSAMVRCYELAQSPNDIETRRSAVELLRAVADRRALPWISEFLDDPDSQIQLWGIGIVDQLLFSDLVEPGEAEELLKRAEHHENSAVREQAESTRGYLRRREQEAAGEKQDEEDGSDGTSSDEA